MKLNIKSSLILLAALSIVEMGCLKDKAFDDGEVQSVHATGDVPKVVEIKLTAVNATNFKVYAFDVINRDTTFGMIPVNLATASPAPEDINVTLQLDPTVIDRLNAKNDSINHATGSTLITDYAVPTSSMYSITNPGLVVTIPKGSNTGYLNAKLNPTNYLIGHWAFGFVIKSIDKAGYTISGNMGTGIPVILIKNKYDGLYSLVINTIGWSAYNISDGVPRKWPSDVGVVTTGETTFTLFANEIGSAAQFAFDPSGGLAGFGAADPQFTFDIATNKLVNVTNLQPDDGRGRAFVVNPAVTDSRYDPATKKMYLAYIMKQNGRPNQLIYDTLTFTKGR